MALLDTVLGRRSMSQPSEVDTLALPSQESTELDATGLVDSYAEHLMDSLFDDVDRLLDGEEVLSLSASALATTPAETEAETTALAASESDLSSTLPSLDLPQSSASPAPPEKKSRFKSLEFWLILGAIFSAAGLGVLWAISQQRLNQAPAAVVDGSAAMPQPNQSNAEFLNYLQRSLEVIANRAETAVSSGGNAVANAPVSAVAMLPGTPLVVPPAPVGMGAVQGSRAPINVIERVYIPYQAAAPATAAAPAPVGQSRAGGQGPTQTAPAPAELHTLVGVLELGSRSAALFEVSGVPQRIYIGERIGSSGWSLVSVSNEQAVIRRNGEVRSIYIGQKF